VKYLLLVCAVVSGWLNAGTPHTVYVKHKAFHALAGLAIYGVGAELGHPQVGLGLAWGAGIGKELYDQRHGGSLRAGDVVWTGLPATVVFVVRW
jgi:hypothetical protein